MTDGLKSKEEISAGVGRLAKKQAAVITKHLKRKRISKKLDSVHQARKQIKSLRALLRLIRERLGPKTYRRENASLRKLGRALSAVRDSTVQLKTLGSLRPGHPDSRSKTEFNGLRRTLSRTQTRRIRALKGCKNLQSAKLRRLERRIGNWPIKHLKAGDLWFGIEKARHRFVDAHRQARLAPDDENIHEWRKRTKDLLHQSEFLKNIKPAFFSRRINRLKQLGDCLGEIHDLAMLEGVVRKTRISNGLLKSAEARRMRLHKRAFELADKTGVFADTFRKQ
jgi:CHAD domain-containing protein